MSGEKAPSFELRTPPVRVEVRRRLGELALRMREPEPVEMDTSREDLDSQEGVNNE